MPAFALPIPPEALTGPPSQAYGTLRYRDQGSAIRSQGSGPKLDFGIEPLQHASNMAILVPPLLTDFLIHVSQIGGVFHPDLHFIRGANRHQQIALEFCSGPSPLAVAFG